MPKGEVTSTVSLLVKGHIVYLFGINMFCLKRAHVLYDDVVFIRGHLSDHQEHGSQMWNVFDPPGPSFCLYLLIFTVLCWFRRHSRAFSISDLLVLASVLGVDSFGVYTVQKIKTGMCALILEKKIGGCQWMGAGIQTRNRKLRTRNYVPRFDTNVVLQESI